MNYLRSLASATSVSRSAAAVSRSGGTNNNHAETHIGQITVHTKATDANGMVRDVGKAVRSNPLLPQSVYPLSG